MKAHVLYGVNDLRYEEVEKPIPRNDEVLVKVEAVGVCGSDIPRIYETGAHRHPLIPGHEFAGTVCEVGVDAGKAFAHGNAGGGLNSSLIGKRVGIFPLIPCGECGPCKNKQYEMCRNYNYLGSRCDGGFAEYVKVPVWNLIELPDNVSFEDASMLEPTSVAAHAMRRMFDNIGCTVLGSVRNDNVMETPDVIKPSAETSDIRNDNGDACDKTVVVIGLGTIGLLLTMHLIGDKNSGNNGISHIYVIGNKEFQREKACELGIDPDDYCDASKEDAVEWLLSKTEGKGADYTFECVGKNETIARAVTVTAPAGRLMLIGNPASDIAFDKNTYWKILRNQLTVLGTWNSSFTKEMNDDWHYVVGKLAAGTIQPSKLISHRLNLEELEKGLHIMRDKTEDYVKVMVKL